MHIQETHYSHESIHMSLFTIHMQIYSLCTFNRFTIQIQILYYITIHMQILNYIKVDRSKRRW